MEPRMSKRARATDTEAPRQNRARAVSELLPAIHGAARTESRSRYLHAPVPEKWPRPS